MYDLTELRLEFGWLCSVYRPPLQEGSRGWRWVLAVRIFYPAVYEEWLDYWWDRRPVTFGPSWSIYDLTL